MQKQSKKFYFFSGLLGFFVVMTLLVLFKTGPVSGPLKTQGDIVLATAAEVPGVTCREQTIPVQLTADAWFTYAVVGTLCWTGVPAGKSLAVEVGDSPLK